MRGGGGGDMRGSQGACMAARGHAWQPRGMGGSWRACVAAGAMCNSWGSVCHLGECMAAGGHAWQLGGMHGSWGVCVGYDEIRSMSGRCVSYGNAFLLIKLFSSRPYLRQSRTTN